MTTRETGAQTLIVNALFCGAAETYGEGLIAVALTGVSSMTSYH